MLWSSRTTRLWTIIPRRFWLLHRRSPLNRKFLCFSYSGITEAMLSTETRNIRDVQAVLMSMFHAKTVLVGHSLESDLKALKIIHDVVVDTSVLFPHKMGPPKKRALKTLCIENLKRIIQENGKVFTKVLKPPYRKVESLFLITFFILHRGRPRQCRRCRGVHSAHQVLSAQQNQLSCYHLPSSAISSKALHTFVNMYSMPIKKSKPSP